MSKRTIVPFFGVLVCWILSSGFAQAAVAPVCSSQSLTVREDSAGANITLQATDADGDLNTISYLITSSPLNGTVSPERGPATVTYVPKANFAGTDSFTWTVFDSRNVSCATRGKVTVTVAAVNDAPIANPSSGSGSEDPSTPIAAALKGKDVDTASSALSYKICRYSACVSPSAALTFPNGATATVNGSNVHYVPAANENGVVEFYYKAFDGQLYSATAGKVRVSIASVNDVPTASPAAFMAGEDRSASIAIATADADGDALTCAFSAPANGTVDPPEATDCRAVFAPAPGFFGTTTFTVTASDGRGGVSEAQTVSVRVLRDGAYLGAWPSYETGLIDAFAAIAGGSPKVIHTFVDTTQSFYAWRDSFMDFVEARGAVNLLTIETKDPATGAELSTEEINQGVLDETFTRIAKGLASWKSGTEVWVRFLHEPNGFWYAWGVGNDNDMNTDESYKQAFRRLANILKQAGAANVKIVYAVNNTSESKNPLTPTPMSMYPGDDYVDYVGLDGYNWGNGTHPDGSASQWQTFREVFDDVYTQVSAATSKPVLLTEFASAEDDSDGSQKAAWIADAFAQLKAGVYPNVVGTVWFDENKEREWSLSGPASSDAIQAAYRERYE